MTDRLTRALAECFATSPHDPPSADHMRALEAEARDLFARIPVRVEFRKGPEPFDGAAEMCEVVRRDRVLVIRDYEFVSCVWGTAYNELRAVHDWFGHLAGHGAFTIQGEIESYYATEHLFAPASNCFVWNETVLANSFKDTYGHPIAFDKVVRSGPQDIPRLLSVGALPGWVA